MEDLLTSKQPEQTNIVKEEKFPVIGFNVQYIEHDGGRSGVVVKISLNYYV